jgi:hypothetical protein
MQVIIYKDTKNGGVVTCVPTGELSIEEVMAKDVPAGCGAKIVNFDDLPNEHRNFYPAWEMQNGEVIVNIEKAKEITKERLRYQRIPLLEMLDVQYQRATETNADTTTIVAEKNRLRDITKLVDSVDDLNQLKSLSC